MFSLNNIGRIEKDIIVWLDGREYVVSLTKARVSGLGRVISSFSSILNIRAEKKLTRMVIISFFFFNSNIGRINSSITTTISFEINIKKLFSWNILLFVMKLIIFLSNRKARIDSKDNEIII